MVTEIIWRVASKWRDHNEGTIVPPSHPFSGKLLRTEE